MAENKELQSLTTPKGVYNSFPDLTARAELEELRKNGGGGAGQNPSGGGLSTTAVNLLVELLENAAYDGNMTGKIERLKVELGYSGGDTPDDPDEPVVTDDITVVDGVMTIISVGSEITVSDGVMTIA